MGHQLSLKTKLSRSVEFEDQSFIFSVFDFGALTQVASEISEGNDQCLL